MKFLFMIFLSLSVHAQLVDFSTKSGEVINPMDLYNSFLYVTEGRTITKDATGTIGFCSWQSKAGTDDIANIQGNCFDNISGESTGKHTVNFVNGYWAQKPNCVCSVEATTSGQRFCNSSESVSNVVVVTANSGSFSYTYDIICHGLIN